MASQLSDTATTAAAVATSPASVGGGTPPASVGPLAAVSGDLGVPALSLEEPASVGGHDVALPLSDGPAAVGVVAAALPSASVGKQPRRLSVAVVAATMYEVASELGLLPKILERRSIFDHWSPETSFPFAKLVRDRLGAENVTPPTTVGARRATEYLNTRYFNGGLHPTAMVVDGDALRMLWKKWYAHGRYKRRAARLAAARERNMRIRGGFVRWTPRKRLYPACDLASVGVPAAVGDAMPAAVGSAGPVSSAAVDGPPAAAVAGLPGAASVAAPAAVGDSDSYTYESDSYTYESASGADGGAGSGGGAGAAGGSADGGAGSCEKGCENGGAGAGTGGGGAAAEGAAGGGSSSWDATVVADKRDLCFRRVV
jgi:hypothetical protein